MQFQRSEPTAVIEMVRAVAEAGAPGEHGHGVEVAIEAPRLGVLGRLLRDWTPTRHGWS